MTELGVVGSLAGVISVTESTVKPSPRPSCYCRLFSGYCRLSSKWLRFSQLVQDRPLAVSLILYIWLNISHSAKNHHSLISASWLKIDQKPISAKQLRNGQLAMRVRQLRGGCNGTDHKVSSFSDQRQFGAVRGASPLFQLHALGPVFRAAPAGVGQMLWDGSSGIQMGRTKDRAHRCTPGAALRAACNASGHQLWCC